MSKITMIPVAELHPHPDNPRKDVGDVTELAESIRANGILQNLTVVPGHYITREEWAEVSARYKEAHDPERREALRNLMNSKWAADGYTVIIGHRRLAAAEEAGLAAVPCTVAEMDRKEQISTMLTENIQRCDLTVYEQAQGFQMMLDMGDSVEDISQKSGFSKSTVRKRLEIAKLDAAELKKASRRQITMGDFDELSRVADVAERNKLLSSIGTANFKNNVEQAVRQQQLQAAMQEWLKVIRTYAKEVEKIDFRTMEYACSYSQWTTDKTAEVPADAREVQYYYTAYETSIEVYRQKDMSAEDTKRAEMAERDRRAKMQKSAFQEIGRRHYALRSAFVEYLSNATCRAKFATVCAFAVDSMHILGGEMDTKALAKLLDLREPIGDGSLLTDCPAIAKCAGEQGEKLVLCAAYAMEDHARQGYWDSRWKNGAWEYYPAENERLTLIYRTLEALGYERSDEEKQMQDGSHPIFRPGYFEWGAEE